MAPQKLTRAQIRDRKAKRLAIVLGVVFAGVLAFQGPKLMKLFSKPKAAAPAASTTTSTGSTATTAGSSAQLVSASAPGQLGDFAGFALKDPFHPLVGTKPAATTGLGTTTTASTTKKTKPKTKPKPATTSTTRSQTQPKAAIPLPGAQPAPVPFTTSKPAPAPPNAALIVTNGKRQVVAVGDSFPRVGPLFKVVSLGRKGKTIKVSVLGGSFTSGAHAIVLQKGETVTLLNEADGSRYVVKLAALATLADTSTSAPAKAASTTTQAKAQTTSH